MRRMRIKAVINVPRSGPKAEPQDQQVLPSVAPPSSPGVNNTLSNTSPSSPVPVPSPRICSGPVSPAPAVDSQPAVDLSSPGSPSPALTYPSRAGTPPIDKIPSSPKSPASWQLQRPSPSKSPLPPSGSIMRRSPSPALINTAVSSRLSSPGPPGLTSPVKSPVTNFSSSRASSYEGLRAFTTSPAIGLPSDPTGTKPVDHTFTYPSSPSPGLESIKSPPCFRPPPSPSPSYQDASKSSVISRPSPAQSPVYMSGLRTSTTFLSHHFNQNSNSADSHEVAALMASCSNVPGLLSPIPPSPDKSNRHAPVRDSLTSRGSENSYPGGGGAFSSVCKDLQPSFSKSVLENPEALKKRIEKKDMQRIPSKFAQARKEFLDKCNGTPPERSKMTMLHFTFWNPPKASDDSDELSKLGGKTKSRSRAASVCSEVDTKLNEVVLDDKGKSVSAPSSIGSRRTTANSIASQGSGQSIHDDAQSDAGSVASNSSSGVPGPRVKVGPNGELIIDEKSLVVETSESQRARQQIEDMEVVSGAEYAVGSSGFYRYKRSYRRGLDWTERETIRFYRALNQCGTDFSMMLNLFPKRSRQELKSKFKREDRKNPDMVSKALASCRFDPDEGISSDEELALYYGKNKAINGELTEKEKILQEEEEVEHVICSSDSPKKKGKKKDTMEFTAAQEKELKANVCSGRGTGKGKFWNPPVIGLSGKLSPILDKVKVERADDGKPAKKRSYKKSKAPSGHEPGVVPIMVTHGVTSGDLRTGVTLILKTETEDVHVTKNKKSGNKTKSQGATDKPKKQRNPKPPKLKLTLKPPKRPKGREKSPELITSDLNDSHLNHSVGTSQNIKGLEVCDDLFRFDATDPLGFKVVPVPSIPGVEETDLVGNEEGTEELVIVDLDELNSITAGVINEVSEVAKAGVGSSKKRKNTDGIPVTTARVVGDPYGKTLMTTVLAGKRDKDGVVSSSSGSVPTNKKVRVLPYRVPGPGGTLPTIQPALADEFEIEIEINPTVNDE